MKKDKEQAEILLKKHQLKITQGRLDVLALLMHEHTPMTVEDIAHKLSAPLNTTTLYRMLDQLSEKGMVYQTHFRDGKAYFEYQGDHHHHHIVCTSCGEREALNICIPSPKSHLATSKKFSTITSHILEFFGLCQKCETSNTPS